MAAPLFSKICIHRYCCLGFDMSGSGLDAVEEDSLASGEFADR